MQVPLSWLKEFIPTTLAIDEIERAFTLAGIEVDSLAPALLPFVGVVVGEVLECSSHPDAEKLCLARVFDGTQTLDIVCGAPNCRKGLKTALARVGALLEDENGEDFKIKKSRIRGAPSEGMLCAADELGLGSGSEGIMELPHDSVPGTDLSELFGDHILEVSLTPNLGHCFSVLGLARELSAITGEPLAPLDLSCPAQAESIRSKITVSVEDVERCPRYACTLIEGVQVGPSPDWLKKRLNHSGLRSINNVVDVSNYVMLELGQPLHAFDREQITGSVVVRGPIAGESLTTLDGVARDLQDELLICDTEGPLAIAGVMGGAASEVTERTTNILLEAAHFDATAVRRSSSCLNIKTDASKRFERGTDPNMVLKALHRTTQLIQQLAGGQVVPGYLDAHKDPFAPTTLTCRVSRVNQLLGTELSAGEIEALLKRLQLEVSTEDADLLHIAAPTYRSDLRQEIDLVEEVARLYGYNNIRRGNGRYTSGTLSHSPLFSFEHELRRRLVGLGLQEVITNTLVSSGLEEAIDPRVIPHSTWVRILNPVSGEHAILRPSLLPSLLAVVARNQRLGSTDLQLFELGTIHTQQDGRYDEQAVAAFLITGARQPAHWQTKPELFDFYDIKGYVETLLKGLEIADWELWPSQFANFHPGRQARICIGEQEIATLGEVHPKTLRALDAKGPLFVAMLNLPALLAHQKKRSVAEPLPQFPGSTRDWTVTLSEKTTAAEILQAVSTAPSRLLRDVEITALYRSEQLGEGQKNITLRLTYRDDRKTIAYKTVEGEHQRITASVLKKIGEKATLRGSKP